jgi:hypothetical protein
MGSFDRDYFAPWSSTGRMAMWSIAMRRNDATAEKNPAEGAAKRSQLAG